MQPCPSLIALIYGRLHKTSNEKENTFSQNRVNYPQHLSLLRAINMAEEDMTRFSSTTHIYQAVIFQVHTAAGSKKMAAFWAAVPCNLVEVWLSSTGDCCLHH
jgi:hypothetical protein